MLIALLTADRVLKGYEEVEGPEAPSDFRIPVPAGCDLKPGKYRWDPARTTFLPILDDPGVAIERPNVLRAVARGFMAIRDGKALPAETLDWLADYEISMDNKG